MYIDRNRISLNFAQPKAQESSGNLYSVAQKRGGRKNESNVKAVKDMKPTSRYKEFDSERSQSRNKTDGQPIFQRMDP